MEPADQDRPVATDHLPGGRLRPDWGLGGPTGDWVGSARPVWPMIRTSAALGGAVEYVFQGPGSLGFQGPLVSVRWGWRMHGVLVWDSGSTSHTFSRRVSQAPKLGLARPQTYVKVEFESKHTVECLDHALAAV